MASFTAGTFFVDGVSNDVTAAKLGALVTNATPTSGFIQDRTQEAIIATNDTLLIGDASDSSNLKRMTVANFAETLPTAKVTTGTIVTGTFGTTTSTAATITTGTITNLSATTSTFLGTITGSTNVINIGSGQIYKDASGNVGVGTTSPSSYGKLAVVSSDNTEATVIESLISNNLSAKLKLGFNRVVGDNTTAGNASLNLGVTSYPQAIHLDSSGNVGIGSTSPANKISVESSGANSSEIDISLVSGTGNKECIVNFGKNLATTDRFLGRIFYQVDNNVMGFNTNNTERLRITSGGEVYIAGTTDQGAYNLQVNGTGVWGAGAYVNGSDSRIKEDIQPLASGLDVVEKLNPVTYKYKETWSSDQSIQSGFIAQELLTALDGQIYIDGVVQHGGTEGYYSVAYQNLIPVLAKAIQELKSENDSLKTRIEALEAK